MFHASDFTCLLVLASACHHCASHLCGDIVKIGACNMQAHPLPQAQTQLEEKDEPACFMLLSLPAPLMLDSAWTSMSLVNLSFNAA